MCIRDSTHTHTVTQALHIQPNACLPVISSPVSSPPQQLHRHHLNPSSPPPPPFPASTDDTKINVDIQLLFSPRSFVSSSACHPVQNSWQSQLSSRSSLVQRQVCPPLPRQQRPCLWTSVPSAHDCRRASAMMLKRSTPTRCREPSNRNRFCHDVSDCHSENEKHRKTEVWLSFCINSIAPLTLHKNIQQRLA